ncbi:purine permease 11 [Populus alba x Populus x berolinensis]|nr:purine permease 11 [Populus alba x Populus x berolinensis]
MEVTDNEEPILNKVENTVGTTIAVIQTPALAMSAAVLLGRFYYDQGGNSKWIATVIQTAGFPILFIPLFLLPSDKEPLASYTSSPSVRTLASIYLVLGVIIAGDNYLYSLGLSYLSASTYSLICASQLAFNAVFSYFINSQKFTALILNSVIILSFSSALIAVNDDSGGPSGVSKWKSFLGFLTTLGASAIYSLLLSLMQLSFQKVIKKETFSVVLEMQIFTSLVATCVSVAGLFASGEWKSLHGEMQSFGKGSVSYVLTLVWTAVTWQVCSVGVVGLIFVVSSLFSNVISTVALAVSPIAAVIVFHDKMNGVKIIAMLLAVWGFASYTYQNYLDDSKLRKAQSNVTETLQLIPNAMGTLISVVVLYLVNQTIFSSFSSSAALIISFASMIHVKKFMKQ